MEILGYMLPAIIWMLLMFFILLLIIRLLVLRRGITPASINSSKVIYAGSAIALAVWILMQTKDNAGPAGALLTVAARGMGSARGVMLMLMLSTGLILLFAANVYLSKFATGLLCGRNNEAAELEANNISFAILRSTLLLACGLVLFSLSGWIFTLLTAASLR